MDTPLRLCGRTFTPALMIHLAALMAADPQIRRGDLARELCGQLDWYSANGRPAVSDTRARNTQSLDEKESVRWRDALGVGAAAARRLPRTQIVVLADREGDLYEMYDGVQIGPPNLHVIIRAQHDRRLESHQKLWAFLAAQAPAAGASRSGPVP